MTYRSDRSALTTWSTPRPSRRVGESKTIAGDTANGHDDGHHLAAAGHLVDRTDDALDAYPPGDVAMESVRFQQDWGSHETLLTTEPAWCER